MTDIEPLLARRWIDLLTEIGHQPYITPIAGAPGICFVHFKWGADTWKIYVDEGDRQYFVVCVSFLLGDQSGAPDSILLRVANEMNRALKVSNVTLDLEARYATFRIEQFFDTLPSPGLFERMLGQCRVAVDRYFDRLKELHPPTALVS